MTVGIEFPSGMTTFGKAILEDVNNKQDLTKENLILWEKIKMREIYNKIKKERKIEDKKKTIL